MKIPNIRTSALKFSILLTAFVPGFIAAVPALADENYPRITAMEAAILGKSFVGEALPARLSRMEVKAFGKASDKADLSDRTDNLQTYVEGSLHKPLVAPGPGFQADDDDQSSGPNSTNNSNSANSNSASSGPDASGSVQVNTAAYPRVTALEQAILEHTYESDQLPDRLARMEVKAFAKATPEAALGDRTDALEDYAEKKLHKKILGQSSTTADSPDSGGNAGGGSSSSGGGSGGGGNFLAKMGGALLGLPVGGMPGSGGGGFFSPGFGPFAGVRARPRSAVAQAEAQQTQPAHAPSPADQAIIDSATPPPPATRLATKVAWCEARVFGQPLYEKHLTDRLNALNEALKFDPGKKGMDLMDDIDKLIQAAAKSKSAAQ